MVIIIDGLEHQVQPGDSYAILADAPHGARFLAESVVVEAFSPPREDYRG
jgi:quercetin dioxygenase-like cupin family protein